MRLGDKRPGDAKRTARATDRRQRRQVDQSQQRARAEAAPRQEVKAAHADARLMDAIDNIPEGFALFDADDHLVLCTDRYREIFCGIADFVVPGVQFGDLAPAAGERGPFPRRRADGKSDKPGRRHEGAAQSMAGGWWQERRCL